MKLNKEIQIKILEACAETRPDRAYFSQRLDRFGGKDVFIAELQYLIDHELVEAYISHGLDITTFSDGVRITTKGIDYLSKEETIGKELGIVTIKLHEDTIKQLIEAKILASDLAQPQKLRFLDRLRSLPADATKHLLLKLVDAGLENSPKLLPLLQNLLG